MNCPLPRPFVMTHPMHNPEWEAWPLTEKLVQLAAYHCDTLKVHEEPKGSNDGEWVRKYLSAAGIHEPAPWCASFVTYLLRECGYAPIPTHPAAVISWAHWGQASHKTVADPSRGDLFYLLHGDGTGHMGIVLENVKGKLRTLEGNTNDEGEREGFEVCRRTRWVGTLGLRFIRL